MNSSIPQLRTRSLQAWRRWARLVLQHSLPRRRFLVSGPRDRAEVCLTFDDGPHPEHTPRLLDILGEEGIRATFFVVGKQAERHPSIVRRMVDEGHRVGNHSYSHSVADQTPAEVLRQEVVQTHNLLAQITGNPSHPFRPPYGKLTLSKTWMLLRMGQGIVLWNVDPRDYACTAARQLEEWFGKCFLRAGDLVLMHDNQPHAAQVLPGLVSRSRNEGLSFVTVDQWH